MSIIICASRRFEKELLLVEVCVVFFLCSSSQLTFSLSLHTRFLCLSLSISLSQRARRVPHIQKLWQMVNSRTVHRRYSPTGGIIK